ncbi:hypothetical protein SLE2022_195930 [Rubroshorea leprosula]
MSMNSHSQFNRLPYCDNGMKFQNGCILSHPTQYQNAEIPSGFQFNDQSIGFNSMDAPFVASFGFSNNSSMDKEWDSSSPSDDTYLEDTILKCISQELMKENMEEKSCMSHDALALHATEKSLYEVLGQNYPLIHPTQTQTSYQGAQNLVGCFSGTFNVHNGYGSYSYETSCRIDPPLDGDLLGNNSRSSFLETSAAANSVFQSTSKFRLASSSLISENNFPNIRNRVLGSSVGEFVIPNYISDSELVWQFNKGVEEARKFLPKVNPLIIDVENIASAPELWKEETSKTIVNAEQEERERPPNQLTGKKKHEREDEDLEEGRSNKQSAGSADENELLDLLDMVTLCGCKTKHRPTCILNHPLQDVESKTSQLKEQTNGFTAVGKAHGKKQGDKEDVVDLRTLLISCAKAVSSNDLRTANEQLKQIREHSSQVGDWYQRLAHFFGEALEARIAGIGNQIYTDLSSKTKSAADILRVYQLYISTCPFQKYAIVCANRSILEFVKEKKATTLHIIDFGILYGFQWPVFILRLSKMPGGPPKLRITGIDFPQRGLRPAGAVEETGRRLAKYCERFNVPFEYNAIAQKWETIKFEDLKIRPNEFVAVNSLNRFKNLFDETVAVNNPRDAVLKLIRKINPDIFVHAIVNGNHNAPFFFTRFKEAIFDYSALLDMCDTIIPREDKVRLMLEKEYWGRQVMNVVACEGTKRTERAETYKQWHARTVRAGFRQRPLNPDLMKQLKYRVKQEYHNDFFVEQDGQWLLQGWKGRILFASSIWQAA